MRCLKLCILEAAARIRVGAGEALEEVLSAWTALSEAEKDHIRAAVEEGST